MWQQGAPAIERHGDARQRVIDALRTFLRDTRLRRVHFADSSVAPPMLGYVTHFPRLSIPLDGCHTMELAQNGTPTVIKPVRGHAVFVPANAWNKPDWSDPVRVLTFLFGVRQIGISMIEHEGGPEILPHALRATVHGPYDSVTQGVLSALTMIGARDSRTRLARLLTESLLHACSRLFGAQEVGRPSKAVRTYEAICLYVQTNFQSAISRESVAGRFGLSPNHVSRLFRQEGRIGFNEYLNKVRVDWARFMLRNYDITLKEIAASCGYSDNAYFCRIFKRITHLTPTQLRQGP